MPVAKQAFLFSHALGLPFYELTAVDMKNGKISMKTTSLTTYRYLIVRVNSFEDFFPEHVRLMKLPPLLENRQK